MQGVKRYDKSVDMFSFGVMIYEIITHSVWCFCQVTICFIRHGLCLWKL